MLSTRRYKNYKKVCTQPVKLKVKLVGFSKLNTSFYHDLTKKGFNIRVDAFGIHIIVIDGFTTYDKQNMHTNTSCQLHASLQNGRNDNRTS